MDTDGECGTPECAPSPQASRSGCSHHAKGRKTPIAARDRTPGPLLALFLLPKHCISVVGALQGARRPLCAVAEGSSPPARGIPGAERISTHQLPLSRPLGPPRAPGLDWSPLPFPLTHLRSLPLYPQCWPAFHGQRPDLWAEGVPAHAATPADRDTTSEDQQSRGDEASMSNSGEFRAGYRAHCPYAGCCHRAARRVTVGNQIDRSAHSKRSHDAQLRRMDSETSPFAFEGESHFIRERLIGESVRVWHVPSISFRLKISRREK